MTAITLSLFELFKIGPGPSSSHTIGPMAAGLDFRRRVSFLPPEAKDRALGLQVTLLGSLSATGKGHGTDRAIAAGLLGWTPDTLDEGAFSSLLQDAKSPLEVDFSGRRIPLSPDDILYGPADHEHPFSNTFFIRLMGKDGPLFEQTYYSTGGGFIQWPGYLPPERGLPHYHYGTMKELLTLCGERNLPPEEILLSNEAEIFGTSRKITEDSLDHIIDVMDAAVARGLERNGFLPGPIGLRRKAAGLYSRSLEKHKSIDRILLELNSRALATAEENAAGSIVVTAPTMGSSGVIPAVIGHLRTLRKVGRKKIRQGMLTAAAIGFLIKHNASIAGAEVGCQGEIGAASAMAAGLLCSALDFSPAAAAAAEIALEHHLGMTCDPVMGFVQVPCVERNAMGAVKAYNAFLLATAGDYRYQKIGFDAVVKVMLETGKDMSTKYKETSQGGLAANLAIC